MGAIDICIGNYSAYNAGYLIDRWVSLPMPDGELAAVIADMQREAQRLTGEPSEEFYVSDYDGYPLGHSDGDLFSEHASIFQLNLLAALIEAMPREAETVAAIPKTGSCVAMFAPDDTPPSASGI